MIDFSSLPGLPKITIQFIEQYQFLLRKVNKRFNGVAFFEKESLKTISFLVILFFRYNMSFDHFLERIFDKLFFLYNKALRLYVAVHACHCSLLKSFYDFVGKF